MDHTAVGIALVEVLGVQLADLVGEQIVQDRREVAKFCHPKVFQKFLEQCEGCSCPMLDDYGTVRVVNFSVKLTYVVIRCALF